MEHSDAGTQSYSLHSPGGAASAAMNIRRNTPEHFECCWNGSGDYGDFRIVKTEIRSGFYVWMTDCLFHQDTRFSMVDHPAAFSFSFCLSGKASARYGIQKQPIEISPGIQGILYYPDPNGTSRICTDLPLRQVGIVISPEQLRSYFESDLRSIDRHLRNIL